MSPLLILIVAAAISNAIGGQTPVNLGTAGNYVILAQSGITTTGATKITGDIAVSPAAAASMTGFALVMDAGGAYSTSAVVTGKVYAADYKSPTPATLTKAIGDQVAAYNDAAGRKNPDNLNVAINGPTTLKEGLYKWTAAMSVDGKITLEGSATSVYIFQVDGALNFKGPSAIILSGVMPSNVIWQSAGAVTLEAGCKVQGIILGKTGIVFNSGAELKGRALAQTAVTMIANMVSKP